MREIKFRAWDSKLKYMFYDGDTDGMKNTTYPVSVTNKGVIYCEKGKWGRENEVRDKNGEVGYKQWEYDKYHWQVELMQYTGLKDKNGKEIYEGDVVNYFGHYLGVVEWKDSGFWVYESQASRYSITDNMEVIGNIYENQELLEETI